MTLPWSLVLLVSFFSTVTSSLQNSAIQITQNTTWDATTHATAADDDFVSSPLLVLSGAVTVFPEITLSIQGTQDKPFVVAFTTDDSEIQLHGGAFLRLEHVRFVGHRFSKNNKTLTTNSLEGHEEHGKEKHDSDSVNGPVGMGVQTISESTSDYYNYEKSLPTILAQNLNCQGLKQCLVAPPASVHVFDSYFDVTSNDANEEEIHTMAVVGFDAQIHRSKFRVVNATGVSARTHGSLQVANCEFSSPRAGGKGVECPAYGKCTVDNSSFLGFYGNSDNLPSWDRNYKQQGMAIQGGYSGSCTFSNSTFVANYWAVFASGCRGIMSDMYFQRNAIAASGGISLASSVLVENIVGYTNAVSTSNVAFCRNLVGHWLFGKYAGDATIDQVTFWENVVAVLGKAPELAYDGHANFVDSVLYHVNYTGTSSVDYREGVYWGHGDTTDKKESVQDKIKDGLNGGGPGIVQFTAGEDDSASSGAVTTLFSHSTFTQGDSNGCVPLKIHAEVLSKMSTEEMSWTPQLKDMGLVQTNPSDNYSYLPESLLSFDFMTYMRGQDGTSNNAAEATSSEAPEASAGDGDSLGTNPDSSLENVNSKDDDPNATATLLQVLHETCGGLEKAALKTQQEFCSSPHADGLQVCPRLCSSHQTSASTRGGSNDTFGALEKHTYASLANCQPSPHQVAPVTKGKYMFFVGFGLYILALHIMIIWFCWKKQGWDHKFDCVPVTDSNMDVAATCSERSIKKPTIPAIC